MTADNQPKTPKQEKIVPMGAVWDATQAANNDIWPVRSRFVKGLTFAALPVLTVKQLVAQRTKSQEQQAAETEKNLGSIFIAPDVQERFKDQFEPTLYKGDSKGNPTSGALFDAIYDLQAAFSTVKYRPSLAVLKTEAGTAAKAAKTIVQAGGKTAKDLKDFVRDNIYVRVENGTQAPPSIFVKALRASAAYAQANEQAFTQMPDVTADKEAGKIVAWQNLLEKDGPAPKI